MLVKLEYKFRSLLEAESVFKEIPTWVKDNDRTGIDIVQLSVNGIKTWYLTVEFSANAVTDIECGDHISPEKKFDLLIETHAHGQ